MNINTNLSIKLKSFIKNSESMKYYEESNPICILDMPIRAINALTHAGIKSTNDLIDLRLEELRKIPTLGIGTIEEIISLLSNDSIPIDPKSVISDFMDGLYVNDILDKYKISHQNFVQILDFAYSGKISISRNEIHNLNEKEIKFQRSKSQFFKKSRNKLIIDLWNSGDHTLQSIGIKLGVTRERIRQILKKASDLYHIPLRSTADVSKQRSNSRQLKELDKINAEDFIELFESGKSAKEIKQALEIPLHSSYDRMISELHKEGRISYLRRTVAIIKNGRIDKSQDEDEKKIRNLILKMRKQDKSLSEIAKACDFSKIRISQTIRKMRQEGIQVPSHSRDPQIYEQSIEVRGKDFARHLNEIEAYLEMGYSPLKIANILDIAPHTIYNIIVENF